MASPPGNPESPRLPAGDPRFATTHWSVVLAARAHDPTQARAAVEQLCLTYWYPLYAYVRRQGHQPADAEDFVQGFIEHVLEHRFFQTADPDKGRFRVYLLTSLNHFLADAAKWTGRLKRGDGQPLLPLNRAAAERRYAQEPSDAANPRQLFERRWAMTLLDTVLQRLEVEATATGSADMFRQLKGMLLGDRGGVSYAELGESLARSEAALKMSVHRLRQRYRELLRDEIAHTVSQPSEIDEEMRHLFKVLSG
ncbi:MAG: RNA polymerase sigma factor [Limisphaerales bacterium]